MVHMMLPFFEEQQYSNKSQIQSDGTCDRTQQVSPGQMSNSNGLYSPMDCTHVSCIEKELTNDADQQVLFGPPIIQRQYSIATVMDVIDNHAIDDRPFQNHVVTQSQAIPIPAQQQIGFDEFRAIPAECQSSLAQPSSDVSRFGISPSNSAISSSPCPTVPFAGYQNLPDTPQSSHFEIANGSFQDDMSPFQTTCSGIQESISCSTPPIGGGGVQRTQTESPVFGLAPPEQYIELTSPCQRPHPALTNVKSCPNFQETCFELEMNEIPSSSSQQQRAMSYNPTSPGSFLEEVAFDEGFQHLTKSDQRRVRNNMACRQSRLRRKLRKENNERRAAGLQTENSVLRRKIKELETECKRHKETILRRMSES